MATQKLSLSSLCSELGVADSSSGFLILCLETADAKKNNHLITGNEQGGGEQEEEGKDEEDKEGEGKTNSNR